MNDDHISGKILHWHRFFPPEVICCHLRGQCRTCLWWKSEFGDFYRVHLQECSSRNCPGRILKLPSDGVWVEKMQDLRSHKKCLEVFWGFPQCSLGCWQKRLHVGFWEISLHSGKLSRLRGEVQIFGGFGGGMGNFGGISQGSESLLPHCWNGVGFLIGRTGVSCRCLLHFAECRLFLHKLEMMGKFSLNCSVMEFEVRSSQDGR